MFLFSDFSGLLIPPPGRTRTQSEAIHANRTQKLAAERGDREHRVLPGRNMLLKVAHFSRLPAISDKSVRRMRVLPRTNLPWEPFLTFDALARQMAHFLLPRRCLSFFMRPCFKCLCWLLGTSVRKTRRFLRTDMPSSQHSSHLARWQTIGGGNREAASDLSPRGAAGQYRLSLTLDMHFCKRQTPCSLPEVMSVIPI